MTPPTHYADRLDGWKAIAGHFNATVGTVQNWEKFDGMPIHRQLHGDIPRVFAYKSELDDWKDGRESHPNPSPGAEAESTTTIPALLPPEPQNHRRPVLWSASLLIALFTLIGSYFVSHRSPAPPPVRLQVTSELGVEEFPSLSPGATEVVYTKLGSGLLIKPVNGGAERKLTASPDISSDWSPDGRWIAFVRARKPDRWDVMIISPQGGEPRALTQIDGIGAAWSHDSQFIAVTDRPSSEKPFQIDRVSVSTGERRQLTFPPPGWWGDIESAFRRMARLLPLFDIRPRVEETFIYQPRTVEKFEGSPTSVIGLTE